MLMLLTKAQGAMNIVVFKAPSALSSNVVIF